MSYNFFEKLTLFFQKNNNAKIPLQKSGLSNDPEEKKGLLSHQTIRRNSNPNSEKKTKAEEDSFKIRLLPSIYLGINVSLILILLFFKYNKNFISQNDLVTKTFIVLPDFFDLYKVNNIIFHCYNIILSIVGFLISFLIYNLLYNQVVAQRKNDFYYTSRLYLMLFFGILSNIFLLIISFTPKISDLELNKELKFLNKIRLNQLFFIGHIFFSCLFCTFSLVSLNLINSANEASRTKWLGYKFIILIYLIIFTLFYVIIVCFKHNLVNYQINSETNYSYSLIIMPYVISFLNSLFIFSFYYETKEARIYFGNMFEKEENNEKNTL
jgi:hypothetical protein